jgi:tetratricopeptide (TPR) repeat protein
MAQPSTGRGDNRNRLRKDLLDMRWPTDQIADEMQRRFGDSALASYRHAHGLSQADVAERWDTICPPSGEATMSGTRISAYERYPAAGTKRPTAGVLAVFAEIYATTPRRLISPDQYAELPAQERLLIDRIEHVTVHTTSTELAVPDATRQITTRAQGQMAAEQGVRSNLVAREGEGLPELDALLHMSERALIMAAAHESSEHAGWAETTNVGEATLEQLDADVFRIANDYVHVPPLPMVVEMLRVRRRVYRLLDGHQKPADTSHLYLLAGTLCGLMANASTDLGYYDAAGEQARAGWAYAELSGHNGLRAWTRGMQALIEYWSERPRQAARLAQGAHRWADAPTAKIRLFNIEARMWSRLGNLEETNRCVRAAAEVRESSDAEDMLHDEVGGVFGFNEAKSHYYAGATYIHLGQADPALQETDRAIELYTRGPANQRSYGAESLARIDSAMAYLLRGSLDGAIDALQPVLSLPVDKRIAQLDERLTGIRHRIAYPAFRNAQEAHDLDERIEEFCLSTAARDLPPTTFAR